MRGTGQARPRVRGFTLLELLVAVALMAILSVLCWRGMEAVLQSRDDITARSNETRALATAFSQLDEDLRRSWAVRLFGLANWPIAFLASDADAPPVLAVLRSGVGERSGRLQRVFFRLRDRVFERGFGEWSPESAAAGRDAESALVWQPLLTEVDGIEYRAWIDPRREWIGGDALIKLPGPGPAAGPTPGPTAPPSSASALYRGPSGVELNIRRRGERFVRVFAVRD